MFDRGTKREARRRVARFLEPGEEVLDFEVGETIADPDTRVDLLPHAEPVHLIATNVGLYVIQSGGRTTRIRYPDVLAVTADAGVLSLSLLGGEYLAVHVLAASPTRGLSGTVCRHVGSGSA